MTRKCTDAEIVTALLSGSTITEAAEHLGVSRRTLYNYLEDPAIDEKLKEATRIREEQLANIRETATVKAIECLTDIVKNKRGLFFGDITAKEQIEAAKVLLTCVSPEKTH